MYEILADIAIDLGMKERKEHEHEGWEKQKFVFETIKSKPSFLREFLQSQTSKLQKTL